MTNAWRNRIESSGTEDPEALLANPRNWRIHPKNQQDALTGVLEEVGWVQDIIVNKRTGHVIDGHLRVSLALRREEKSVPVKYVDLEPHEEELVLATFDPIAALAATDTKMLDELMHDVTASEASVQQLLTDIALDAGIVDEIPGQQDPIGYAGLPYGEPTPGLTDPDAVPEVPLDEPTTKPGEVWSLGSHRLMCGDAREMTEVGFLLAGARPTLIYTDPPWGVGYAGGTKVREKLEGDKRGDTQLQSLFNAPFVAAAEHGADKCALFIWHAGAVGLPLYQAADDYGWVVRSQIIWNKNQAQFGALGAHYHQKHEPALLLVRASKPPKWNGPTNEVSVWDCARARSNEFHPTQKPVELGERAINNQTDSGDAVLDLYGGSGATILAAENTGRTAYLMELSPAYCDVIIKRWEQFTGATATLASS